MSCLAGGLRGNPASLGAALSIGWMCECLGPWHRGCQHSLQHAKHSAHTRTHTHTCLSILATAQGMPTHQLACVLARWGERGLGCSEQGQSMCAFMSFMFFYVIAQHAFAGRWCLCETCVLSDQGKISCYFQMALFKRLLWCIKSDLKCACSCL